MPGAWSDGSPEYDRLAAEDDEFPGRAAGWGCITMLVVAAMVGYLLWHILQAWG